MLAIPTHHVKYDPSVSQYPLPQSNETTVTALSKPTPDLKQAISNAIQKTALEEISFNVSPNPTSGSFKISMPVAERNNTSTVWVYDMQGKEVFSGIIKGSNNVEVKLEDAMPGSYLVRVLTEKGTQYKSKIMVQ